MRSRILKEDVLTIPMAAEYVTSLEARKIYRSTIRRWMNGIGKTKLKLRYVQIGHVKLTSKEAIREFLWKAEAMGCRPERDYG